MRKWKEGDFLTPEKLNDLENNFSKILTVINSSQALIQRNNNGSIAGYTEYNLNNDKDIVYSITFNEEKIKEWIVNNYSTDIGIVEKTEGVLDRLEINYALDLTRLGYKGKRPSVATELEVVFNLDDKIVHSTKLTAPATDLYTGTWGVLEIPAGKIIVKDLAILEQLSNSQMKLKAKITHRVCNYNGAYSMNMVDTITIKKNSIYYKVPTNKYKIQL